MNAEDGSEEENFDLGLSLNNQSNLLVNDSGTGAGANAASRMKMAFVSSDPLSELVWSPHQGLRLKCTDSSFTEQRPSLFWGLGPSNMDNIPCESLKIPESYSEKFIDKSKPQYAVDVKRDFGANSSFTKYSARNAGTVPLSIHQPSEELSNDTRGNNTAVGIIRVIANEEHDCKDHKMMDTDPVPTHCCRPNFPDTVPRPGDYAKTTSFGPIDRYKEVSDVKEIMLLEVGIAPELDYRKRTTLPGGSPPNPTSSTKHEDLPLIVGDQGRRKEKPPGSCSAPLGKQDAPLEKHGSNAENYVGAAVYKIVDSESDNDIKNIYQEGPGGKNLVVEHSPTNSQTQLQQRKGKRKALSDADVSAKMFEHEDNSRESVESCNSAGYFASGKKRWNFEEEFITGSKRLKKQIQEGPESSSAVAQSSSFMNWISNMAKGFSKSYQDDTPSLALGPGHSKPRNDTLELVKHEESGGYCQNTGFQSIFRSLYSPISKELVTSVNTEGLQKFNENKLGKQVIDVNVSPISCRLQTVNSFQQYSHSNEKNKQYTTGNDASAASTLEKIRSVHVSAQENEKLNKEKNSSRNLAGRMQMCHISPSCLSLGKYETVSGEGKNSDLPSKSKVTPSSYLRSDPLGSLWVTRFCSRSAVPLSCHFNQNTAEAGCTSPQPLICIDTSKDERCMEAKDIISPEGSSGIKKNSNTEVEFSAGFIRCSEQNYLKCESRKNSTPCSKGFRKPEAIASTFAKRLDALKQIMSSDASLNTDCAAVTCLFCGTRGHNLLECSEIPKTELDDLRQKWNSRDRSEDSPSLCVKCFQLNHQASECPNASSRRYKMGDKTEQTTENEDIPLEVLCSDLIRDRRGSDKGSDLRLPQKLHKMMLSKERVLNPELSGHDSTTNSEKNEKNSFLPKGFFDHLKGLRLSRKDILKWRDTHRSLSQLNGFFVRLRVGKLEKGLGGTGYHVACIDASFSGAESGDSSPQESSKSSISVCIDGVKCIIRSQYISNHDFLEDELMAWCTATIQSGHKLPSAEDLCTKTEKRAKLGF